jgi:hypothetical protein
VADYRETTVSALIGIAWREPGEKEARGWHAAQSVNEGQIGGRRGTGGAVERALVVGPRRTRRRSQREGKRDEKSGCESGEDKDGFTYNH